MKYLRFSIMPILILVSIISLLLGPFYIGLFFMVLNGIFIMGDYFLPQDKDKPIYKYTWILNGLLYINLPLLFILYFILAWYCSGSDLFGFGAWIQNNSSFDILNHKKNIYLYHYIILILSSGLLVAGGGTVVAHELVHRNREKISKFVGNWLMSFSFDMAFAIDHVYGHHKDVCLKKDSATAQRGQSIYHFIFSSSIGQFITAYNIELKINKPIYQNRLIQNTFRSIIVLCAMYLMGGLFGVVIALSIALVAKILLEAVNYIEHYGLVRKEGAKVFPRHSWNSNHLMSNIMLYNLSRHSHHHEKAYLEFWELEPYDDAPEMPYGYLSMIYIALLLPWYYHRIMAIKLIDWDRRYANDDEKEIAKEDNKNSGLKILIQA
tara:strand:+ start:1844 stop:2980 length:1137 start_codon:yes stop_codon:yes gene_type:complete